MAEYAAPPLEVFAVDGGFLRLTGSIPYKSLRWVRRYRECGEFEMVVPADVYSPDWAYIYADDRPEMGIVQKVEYADDAQTYAGTDSVTVSGRFLESALNNIVFLAESPEQKKVYVPEPRRPVYVRAKNPRIFNDGAGGSYYENSAGDIVNSATGAVVTDGSHLVEVDYVPAYGVENAAGEVESSYSYYSPDGKSIVRIGVGGREETYRIQMKDDRGNVWYLDGEKNAIVQAVGVVEKRADTYRVAKKRWDALPDDDPYGRYYMETVKGPWQRTEMLEPVTEGDSVDIVFRWARRMMGDWLLYEEPRIKGVNKAVDPSFRRLGDLMYETLGEVGASLRLEYLFESNKFILSVYKGKDRTQRQSANPWAVFSDTWGAVSGFTASRDDSNYKNTCYVLYDYDVPSGFDETGWPSAGFMHAVDDNLWLPTLYGIRHESKRGYNVEKVGEKGEPAAETYLDLRGEKPSCDKDWSREVVEIPGDPGPERDKAVEAAREKFAKPADAYDMRAVYAAWEKSLPGRGEAYLREEFGVVTELDAGAVRADRYLKDYDLGDLVDLHVSAVGLTQEARIVEVEESYDERGGDVRLVMEEERLTARKAR